MSEYKPTEDEVREEWAYGAQDLDMDGNVVVSLDEGFAQFDRFIATVKADAWDEGYRQGVDDERIAEATQVGIGLGGVATPNRTSPYRKDES